MNILVNLRKNQKVSDAIAVLPARGVLYDRLAVSGYVARQLQQAYEVTDFCKGVQGRKQTAKNCINCAAPVKLQRDDCDHCGTIY